ncbi:Alpha/Beta hydrolase protein [Gymnopilus junonius]|uniref:Alpha/Beta hydrolase protein n=1 Tax=Gymnopilus junonius TaxID=109634 RepID=A0A9P5NSI7_GYMJU|nr:Alpha/Beta hydrolase protein [Gymnopilus junonius]
MSKAYSLESLDIVLPSGVILKADLFKPSNLASGPNKLAVCLHPWSWLGGRKDDPVLSYLAEPLLSQDYYVLRYNSRGVGGSSGWASLTGFREAEDLKATTAWALDKISNVNSLVILGYSHGSLVASMHPVLDSVKTSHILLSYPLGPRTFLTLFNSSSYTKALNELIQHPQSNVLVIYGDCDEFTSQSNYKAWAPGLESENVEIHEVEGASHFWHGHSAETLGEIVNRWLGSIK